MFEKLKGYIAALLSSDNLTAEQKAELEAAEKVLAANPNAAVVGTSLPGNLAATVNASQAVQGQVAGAQTQGTSPDVTAALTAMQTMAAAQAQEIADLKAQINAGKADTTLQSHVAQIDSLVRQRKMTPAQGDEWKKVAKSSAAAFEAALPALQAAPTVAQLVSGGVKSQMGGSEPASRLHDLTQARMKDNPTETYGQAMRAVCSAHPDLADAQRAKAPSVGGGSE